MPGEPSALQRLATEFGIATEFRDWRGRRLDIGADTLRAVLAAMDVDASSARSVAAALAERRQARGRLMLPPYVTARAGQPEQVRVHAGDGARLEAELRCEDGVRRSLPAPAPGVSGAAKDRGQVQLTVPLPADLAPGYHHLTVRSGDRAEHCEVIVAPAWLGLPASLGTRHGWGLAAQLYSVRSHRSWGVGDLADLADLAAWAAAGHGADFVLVNPLHAGEPVPPLDPSPYLPSSRRFANPLYLRVERILEYADLAEADRAEVARLHASTANDSVLLERDASWTAKRAALQVVYRAGRTPGREIAFRAYCRREGSALDRFAVWCVLVEDNGADWRDWPTDFRHPNSPAVAAFAAAQAARLDFYRWLQWQLDEQLGAAQRTARDCGMALGVMHDLAVGVSTTGADSWACQDALARGVTVGAPPDAYAHTGQDWNQPPWRPDRLAALAYRPLRELFGAVLRHAGGLRIDHVIGLFRLWWIPAGMAPTQGTYVHYDHHAAIATAMIEAQRAGAALVGEDLGTVQPEARAYLRERGVLGTSILWFARDWDGDGAPIPPQRWREHSLASVTTHDLPPTSGYLAGDHVRLRHELGLLSGSVEDALSADRAQQQAWLALLRELELLAPGADEAATIEALHRLLVRTPARLRCLALTDAVGERRTQNQPGTQNEYPNWRIPLGGPDGAPYYLEDVFTDPRAAALAEIMCG